MSIINKNEYNYISKDNTLWVHGVLALLIFICHIPNYIGLWRGNVFGAVVQSFGAWAVAIFFFLSGYGLTVSFLNRGGQYLNGMPTKRILPLYLKMITLLVVYLVVSLLLGNNFELALFLKSLFIGDTYILNGWYLQTLILFYFMFLICFKNKLVNKSKILLLFGITILYMATSIVINYFDGGWYSGISSILFFPIGSFYAVEKEKIDSCINKNKIFSIIIAFLLIIIAGVLLILRKKIELPFVLNQFRTVFISSGFALGVLILIQFFNLNFKVTRFLGKFSFEIYVLQGIGFTIASSSLLNIGNLYLQLLVSIIITALLCWPFHYVFGKIDNLFRKKRENNV